MTTKIHKLQCAISLGFVVLVLAFSSNCALASKGDTDDKDKKGYVLKVNGFEVKKSYTTPLSLMPQGATYKGTVSPMQIPNASGNGHSIITYKKGNTIYIYPIQQKGIIHRFKTPSKN
jgi:hypothetical protein